MTTSVLAISSGGGHWVQLLRLRDAFKDCDIAYVSVDESYREDVPGDRFYVVQNVTRWDRWHYVRLVRQLVGILLKERPDVIVTTGAAPALLALMLGKMVLRSRTMRIASIANSEKMSLSGRLARRFADAWLTQWPELSGPAGPRYWGAVL